MEVERYKMIYYPKVKRYVYEKSLILDKFEDEIKSDNVRILGHNFVKNNKNKVKLLINNKKYNLKEFVDSKEFKEYQIKINIILSKGLSNISYMFENCFKLEEFSIYDNINIDNEEYYNYEENFYFHADYGENINENDDNIYKNFYKNLKNNDIYTNISEVPQNTKSDENQNNSTMKFIIDNIITKQYNYYSNMSHMFYNCPSLEYLPDDISNWNTNNVRDISGIFYNCFKLSSLPDISEWNINNVRDMSEIFSYCDSLKSLPDVSKWNTINVNNMSRIFSSCSSLSSLPDISKWNTNNVNNMSGIFSYCESLSSLPDVSKWNTINVNDMQGIFTFCLLLSSLPDISKWNTICK